MCVTESNTGFPRNCFMPYPPPPKKIYTNANFTGSDSSSPSPETSSSLIFVCRAVHHSQIHKRVNLDLGVYTRISPESLSFPSPRQFYEPGHEARATLGLRPFGNLGFGLGQLPLADAPLSQAFTATDATRRASSRQAVIEASSCSKIRSRSCSWSRRCPVMTVPALVLLTRRVTMVQKRLLSGCFCYVSAASVARAHTAAEGKAKEPQGFA